MPRAPRTPRLEDLEPADVAAQAARLLLDAGTRLAELAGWALHADEPGASPFGGRVADLVRWTQAGEAELRDDAVELLDALVPALFARPIDGPPSHEPPIAPSTGLGVLLCAALARRKLEARDPVPAVQLAALGGVDVSRVRQHIRQGELRRTTKAPSRGRAMDAPVRPGDARRWLGERDVVIAEAAS